MMLVPIEMHQKRETRRVNFERKQQCNEELLEGRGNES